MYTSGSTIEISYDYLNDLIVYEVFVAADSFVAVGYGDSMTDTDMCFWSGNGAKSI